jgi:hypothetical protein
VARLRNVKSGAIVVVPDEKAARLGGEWEPVEVPAPVKAPRKQRAKKSED